MGTVVIKTGMTTEQRIARKYAAPGTLILTGNYTADMLELSVPKDCKAIISVGVCGGLSPAVQIGEAVVYVRIKTPTMVYDCDAAWVARLVAATDYYKGSCWSSGQFNTANTPYQRGELFEQTGCSVIDDESFAVAQFAAARGIALAGMRTISDGAEDSLPPAVINALNSDGSDNLRAVLESVATDPLQLPALIRTALEAKRSFDELETACIAVGPDFQWQS